MNKEIDFLAIGDIVTDRYIKIKDAHVTCDINHEHYNITLGFGDKIPYESAQACKAVGNGPNAAVSAARLGLNSYIVSYLGEDETGKESLEILVDNGVKIDFMETVPKMSSNEHFVLWYQTERTIFIKHEEYPYHLPNNLPESKWVYLSSLASNSLEYHKEILKYLEKYPKTKLAFSPGTLQIKLGKEKLSNIYKKTEILLCNKDEAQRILDSQEEDPKKIMEMILELGPKMCVITAGMEGAYASDGKDFWFIPVYPHKPIERTGAGDAFSSTFIGALILGKTFSEALMWAPVNAMSVAQKIGPQAGLLSQEKIENILNEAPEDFKISKLN